MLNLVIFVPSSHLEIVKSEIFKKGAGTWGNYDCCSFELYGKGQFRSLAGSNPYIGKMGEIEEVEEVRVEVICKEAHIKEVIKAMKAAHPYETPAYYVTQLLDY